MRSYSGYGSISSPPPPSPTTQKFTKEEERGKWDYISDTIKFVTGYNVYGGGGGSVEVRESWRECV